MKNYCLNKLLFLILSLTINNAFASDSLADGEAIVTVQNGQPCFSYPLDEATKKNKFHLYEIEVYENKGGNYSSIKYWDLDINPQNRKSIISLNAPEQCFEYGVVPPLTKHNVHAIPIKINTPYRVFLTIYSPEIASSSASFRTYFNDFCLTLDTNNKKTVIIPEFNSSKGVFECGAVIRNL